MEKRFADVIGFSPFDDARYRRELRRVTTLDVEQPAAVPVGA